MRIALYHNLPPGGALRVVRESVAALARLDGVQIEVFLPDLGDASVYGNSTLGEYPGALDVHVTLVAQPLSFVRGPARRPISIAGLRRAERDIVRSIDRGGFDVVVVHHCQLTHSPALLRRLRTPSLYYLEETRRLSTEYALQPRLRRARPGEGLGRRIGAVALDIPLRGQDIAACRAAGRLVTSSHATADAILRAYGRRAAVCYPGIDLDLFSPGEHRSHGHLLSVGALHPSKGHDLVIRAAGRVGADRRPSVVVVNERGVPGYAEYLERTAMESGVRLEILTSVPEETLVDLYRGALATVSAAELEPLGLTPLESIGCGTPVIAVDEGGHRETVQPGVTGLLVSPDEVAIAEAIAAILDGRVRFDPCVLRSAVDPHWRWETAGARLLAQCAQTAGLRLSAP